MTRILVILMLLAGTAAAEKTKILVLPLAPTKAIDDASARLFDARLLVALDDTRRIQTLTHDEEPECTTNACLAELGSKLGAVYVLSLAVVREDAGLTVFGTLVDVKSATAWRRVELPRIAPQSLAKTAPAELVPQILGTAPAPTGGPVLGFGKPTAPAALTAATDIIQSLTAQRAFKVVPLDATDRTALTHRADIAVTEFSIATPRRLLCTWYDGKLVGTFSITDLATGKAVFSKTVTIEVSRRAHFSSHAEITQALVDGAVAQWLAAFRAQPVLVVRR
jgi:hypothetical protein